MPNVLVIDDDERIRKVIRLQLKSTGYTVFEAEHDRQAFEWLGSRPIDIIVCDIKMKGLSGIEVLRAVKQVFPSIPFIILTGLIGDQYAREAKEAGCFAYLNKPVRKETLLEVLGRAAAEKKRDEK